ncbi:MAG TPA: bifunctional acetate--CoA ligase family protein/GNAT family N-acetyltransferase [Verrucomicrobiae bacterium]
MTTPIIPSGRLESAHDILHQTRRRPLGAILSPKTIAVIGATERKRSVGRTVMQNLLSGGFPGKIYPVNPIQENILGLRAYPNVAALPAKPDLAVIITPPKTVPGIIKECAQVGIPGVIIISAGFKEIGAEGAALEQQVLAETRRGNIRVVGPNCLGVMVPGAKFNATFAADMARPGSVAFLSQSGALCTAILDWSLKENVGFSAFVSLGSMLDVGWGDLIYHLGDDPNTKSIVIYMESIGDASGFLSAAREVALTKPIIVIKPGRTEAAAKAAASHTGSLTGSDEVLQAAFQRVGVLRVEAISELFDMAEVLGKQPRPKGPRLTIVTNAGGPGVLATDMLIGSGAQLADLTPETMASLNQILPPTWSHNNPVDIIGDAGPELYAKAVDIVAKDPNTDGLLVILTPQAMTDPTATAEELKPFAHIEGKPILASWMGVGQVEKGEDILNAVKIPTFKYPDRAAKAFYYMWRYSENLRALYETPAAASDNGHGYIDRDQAAKIISEVRKSGRTILTEFESKQLLAAYAIPTVETHVALSESDAVKEAARFGFPVVLKLHSETITHKTDVGGIQLNLRTASAVRQAWKAIEAAVTKKVGKEHFLGVTVQPMIKLEGYELIIGSSIDQQFGPVLLFGTGGQLVEVYKDRALGLPPLNATLARRMMERTRIFTALKGVRGRKAVNIPALEQLLVRFSQLVVEQPWIAEIDINPLLASSERIYALDARVVLHDPKTPEDKLPKPAIRPYPVQYVRPWKLKNKAPVTIRPIRPEDEPLMVKFHETLSEESVYHRYFSALHLEQRIAHERLTRICFNDYNREIALVAELKPAKDEEKRILGVGRLSKIHGLNEAEFALLISDEWQNLGLGLELLKQLVEIGRVEKLDRIFGEILADNHAMRNICKKLGFKIATDDDQRTCSAQFVFLTKQPPG